MFCTLLLPCDWLVIDECVDISTPNKVYGECMLYQLLTNKPLFSISLEAAHHDTEKLDLQTFINVK